MEKRDGTRSLDMGVVSADTTVHIRDSNGDGLFQAGETVAFFKDEACHSLVFKEKTDLYQFAQRDLLGGIAEQDNISGLSRFGTIHSPEDARPLGGNAIEDELKRLMPLIYPYFELIRAIKPKGDYTNKTFKLGGNEESEVAVKAHFSEEGILEQIKLLSFHNGKEDNTPSSWFASIHSFITGEEQLERALRSFDIVHEDWTKITFDKNGEVEWVELVWHYPDGNPIQKNFLRNAGGHLELHHTVPVKPRLPDEIPFESRGTIVTILEDSGVDWQRPSMQDRLAWNLMDTPDGFDNDANGYVDDFLGWDFDSHDNLPFDYSTDLFTEIICSPYSYNYTCYRHGTGVADVASRDSKNLRILPISIPKGRSEKWAEKALAYARSRGSRIINMSFGDYEYKHWQAFEKVIKENRDVLFITSAGNDGNSIDIEPFYPSSFSADNLIVVAALNGLEVGLAELSNYGPESVDLAAAGEDIETIDTSFPRSGTSYAAPAVANAVGQIWAMAPHLSVGEVMGVVKK